MKGPTFVFQTTALVSMVVSCAATTVRTETPIMGWNSYNAFECHANQEDIQQNANALVQLGLNKLGYTYVTPDCGWYSGTRDVNGALEWNSTAYPDGGKKLGDFIHDLGLKFGVYSGSGTWQCGSYQLHQGSINHEKADAEAFASWGADSLKYDTCYVSNSTSGADFYSVQSKSSKRFRVMADALSTVKRDIVYQLCQWGIGDDLVHWGSVYANSWRISVDIFMNWESIYRITNQVIPFAKYTKPGAFPDMDMLIVGLGVLSEEEERLHFGMWSIFKSPLILGNNLAKTIPQSSLNIITNSEVIAINQDSLGKSAELVRRFGEEEYDIYAGPLSGGRMVVGIANWKNTTQTVELDLPGVLQVSSATARDVWAHQDLGRIRNSYIAELAGHQLKLLVLSNIRVSEPTRKSSTYYYASEAQTLGNATRIACAANQCLPAGSKVTNIGSGSQNASVVFSGIQAHVDGVKLLGMDFINYDVAYETSWKRPQGTSTRNLTLSVNSGPAKRWAFPISGGNWYDTGRLFIEVDGFKAGNNIIELRAVDGWVKLAPDMVGIEVIQ